MYVLIFKPGMCQPVVGAPDFLLCVCVCVSLSLCAPKAINK